MSDAQAAPRIAVPLAIDLAALESIDPAARVISHHGATMGTTWRVRAAMPPSLRLDEAQVAAQIEARLDSITRQMSHWDAGSLLSRFNHAPAGTVFTLPHDFAEVMARGLAIAEASGGAFDPAIGRLTDLWGLGPNPAKNQPCPDAVAGALHDCGWQRLRYDAAASTLTQPGGVWLDLSGIAKGYAVDAIADLLGELGIGHALVEIGGECSGRGMRPDGDPWWVDIENPPACTQPPLRIAMHQLAIATSGDYLRGAHTLDPRSGMPVMHSTTAVSVVHRSCMIADAWATALGVLGLEEAQDKARAHDLAARIVDRGGNEWLSPAMQSMM